MERETIILGDIEMGGGTLTDDFISDKALSHLIRTLSQRAHRVDLVLNGDTFDFLKCPSIVNQVRSYPRHITQEISLAKLKMIYQSHQPVFAALQKFVRNQQHRLFFIIGNHDHDLFFPAIQQQIKSLLNGKRNILFRLSYHQQGVYTEHGQQYDYLNRIKPRQPFYLYKGELILNIPWVSFGLISRFMHLKEEHPFLERIKPIPVLFSHHQALVKKLNWRSIKYLILGILYFPIRHYCDPTYNFPKELLRELYRRVKHVHWEVEAIAEKFKRKRRRLLKNTTVAVLGHIHEHYVEEKNGTVLIHPSTWRDEYHLDEKTKFLTPLPKRYVHVVWKSEQISWNIVELPVTRKGFSFEKVIADEKTYIQKAAEEEEYSKKS